MIKYESNSHKSRELTETKNRKVIPKNIQQVTTSPVRVKKKTGINKLASLFLADDVNDIKSSILLDVVVPGIKDAILDIVHMLLNGTTSGRFRSGRGRSGISRIQYDSIYDSNISDRRRQLPQTIYDYDDIEFDNRREAEDVLMSMHELIATYGIATVSDFYDLCGITVPGYYTAEKYGWSDIRNATVIRTRGGWIIKFPKVMPIN